MTARQNTIGVIGAGAFGTALATTLARAGRDVVLYARDPGLAAEIATARTNRPYLPGATLDARLQATADLAAAAARGVVLLATPAQASREMLGRIAPHLALGTPLVLAAKGLEQTSGRMLSEVAAEAAPGAVAVALSGPSFAADMVQGLPTALTLAAEDPALGARLAALLGHSHFRLYWTSDLVGVQLGGAVKNVLAIAAGIVTGRRLGASAHAALVTRGFAELTRFAVARGARPETLAGLSGLGDLILTTSSVQSRNYSLGIALGEGRGIVEVLGGRRSVSEGVHTAAAVAAGARALGIEVPISAAVAEIVAGRVSIDAAIEGLLARPLKAEI
jgi:glycerol-3-phosphate dehydrogenase (NAD(P)+)